ncbi:MAG: preprotein translocase subunit SecG [Robiginitomaculum sp.]|nr:preprotein translocase subunit SecG [Robiginitomaculum sp.]
MTTVLLTIHFLISVALIVSVLMQRSEGGALGIGGGPGGVMSGRAATTVLSRATGFLGAAFFLMSILLTVIPNWGQTNIDSEIIGQENLTLQPTLDLLEEKPVDETEPE